MYKPTHAAQPDRRPLWEALILAALLALFLAIQLPKLDSVPWDQYESWRQSDTYSIAVNYVQYGMDLLHPQLNYDGVSENYAQLELQIVPYLSRAGVSADRHHDPGGAPAAVYAVLFGLGLVPVPADARDLRPVACTGWAGDLPFCPCR
ncbi:MAG: hypothetical protein ACLR1T_10655 [Evtepia gabavorous]